MGWPEELRKLSSGGFYYPLKSEVCLLLRVTKRWDPIFQESGGLTLFLWAVDAVT